MVRGKKGDEKYYIIISLILGLLVLGLSLFYIFEEYFTEDDVNWETCRQSLVLRNSVPAAERIATMELESAKEQFPLKCKTEVVEISWEDVPEEIDRKGEGVDYILKQVADKMVECWKLYGQGEYHIFPGKYTKESKDCGICYRIVFKDDMQTIRLPLGEYLYGHNLDGKKVAFNSESSYGRFFGNLFKISSSSFHLPDDDDYKNRLAGKQTNDGVRDYLDITEGDLLVGVYFYSNNNLIDGWRLGGRRYLYSMPFYVQTQNEEDMGEFRQCNVQTIPA